MELLHVFHSTSVNGPEALAIPALSKLSGKAGVVFLRELRAGEKASEPIRYAESFGIPTFVISVRSRYDLAAMKHLGQLFVSQGARIVHAHDVKASTYTLKASRLSKCNALLVSTHHGVRARIGLRNKLYEYFYVRSILPHFDRVLAVCSSDRRILLRRGLRPNQVLVHLNGVNRPYIAPAARGEQRRLIHERWGLGVETGSVILGMVGRLAPEKRVDKLLRVLAELRLRHPDLPSWRFLCFGTGPLAESLEALAKQLGLESVVNFRGYRPRVGDEMAGFDILLSLSDAEGLPVNLLEAGWAGTPVFATAIDGIVDLIPSDSFGRLVATSLSPAEVADALSELVMDELARRRLGAALGERVKEDFSEESWLKRLLEIYSEGLSELNEGQVFRENAAPEAKTEVFLESPEVSSQVVKKD